MKLRRGRFLKREACKVHQARVGHREALERDEGQQRDIRGREEQGHAQGHGNRPVLQAAMRQGGHWSRQLAEQAQATRKVVARLLYCEVMSHAVTEEAQSHTELLTTMQLLLPSATSRLHQPSGRGKPWGRGRPKHSAKASQTAKVGGDNCRRARTHNSCCRPMPDWSWHTKTT